jgi:hypothetical protein
LKYIIFGLMGVVLFLGGCSSQSGNFAFGSSDCNEVHRDCISKCIKEKPRRECEPQCYKAKSICQAMKVKGCMQACNERYEKDSRQNEICKRNCEKQF